MTIGTAMQLSLATVSQFELETRTMANTVIAMIMIGIFFKTEL